MKNSFYGAGKVYLGGCTCGAAGEGGLVATDGGVADGFFVGETADLGVALDALLIVLEGDTLVGVVALAIQSKAEDLLGGLLSPTKRDLGNVGGQVDIVCVEDKISPGTLSQ